MSTYSPLISFLCGAGLVLCLAWAYLARVRSRHVLVVHTAMDDAAAAYRQLDLLRARQTEERRRKMLQDVTGEPLSPRRYVLPAAPLVASASPARLPIIDAPATVLGQVWIEQAVREAARCARVRADFDRTVCFDIQCPSCFPRPVRALPSASSAVAKVGA